MPNKKLTEGLFWIQRKCTNAPFYSWENTSLLIKEWSTLKKMEEKLIKIMEYDKKNYSDMSLDYRILEQKIDVVKFIKGEQNGK